MVSPVANVAPAQPAVQAPTTQPTPSKAAPPALAPDTVQISNAAKVMLQESMENPAQTAKEAAGGDR